MARCYANENFPLPAVETLWRLGHNVLTTAESSRAGQAMPDAIYLSAAAWLAVHQAEARTSLVDTFPFKELPEPVPIHRIEQTHRTRVTRDQYIGFTDLRDFSVFADASPMTAVEKSLLDLVGRTCRELGGTKRFNAGDGYCLTFPDASLAMAAVERLAEGWGAFERREGLHCPMNVVVHKGVRIFSNRKDPTHRSTFVWSMRYALHSSLSASLAGSPSG